MAGYAPAPGDSPDGHARHTGGPHRPGRDRGIAADRRIHGAAGPQPAAGPGRAGRPGAGRGRRHRPRPRLGHRVPASRVGGGHPAPARADQRQPRPRQRLDRPRTGTGHLPGRGRRTPPRRGGQGAPARDPARRPRHPPPGPAPAAPRARRRDEPRPGRPRPARVHRGCAAGAGRAPHPLRAAHRRLPRPRDRLGQLGAAAARAGTAGGHRPGHDQPGTRRGRARLGRRHPWQGHGFASEAARAVAAWLAPLPVGLLVAHIHPEHAASAAVAAGCGLRPTGRRRDGEVRWESGGGRGGRLSSG